ncbi:hypothetical protein BGZ65_003021 [Modicella reniformis]|uniref:Uncharacterized protein n=1 Tax=Modicella reniformis TaxID=1440133 RepID=A0A9P6ILT5_9FUNG|nr:hypothetical protein BGZ65_003021 [Modicella reniformis]
MLLRSAAVYQKAPPRPHSILRVSQIAISGTRSFSSNKPQDGASGTENENSSKDPSSANPLGKVSGIVNSILHGSGSLAKVQSQESWGVSLARGKYIHEVQKHRVQPAHFDDYVQLVSEVFPRMVKESNNKLRLTGSWLTEIGEQDTAGK